VPPGVVAQWCQWLSSTPLSMAIRQSDWWFSIIESVHVLGVTLMVGTIAIVDLRLLGWLLKREPVSSVTRAILPWTWCGLVVMAGSGALLFTSEASDAYRNTAFRIKSVLLVAAGLNALLFHRTTLRSVSAWEEAPLTPVPARRAAALSLALWGAIVVCGRAIAYFH
jgi:hypothetical protein